MSPSPTKIHQLQQYTSSPKSLGRTLPTIYKHTTTGHGAILYYYNIIMIKKKSRPENCYYNARKHTAQKTTPADRVIKKLLKNMIICVGIQTGCRTRP